jgi:hypothetical protein
MTLMMGAPIAAVGPVVETVRAPLPGMPPHVDPWWFYPLRQYWRTGEWMARLRKMVTP